MGTDATPPAERLAEIKDVTDRARAGDPTAVPRLVQLIDEYPAIAVYHGDLATQAVLAWVSLVAGPNLLLRESVAGKVDMMRKELGGEKPCPIVDLAVDRVILTWLSANHACAQEAASLDKGENPKLLALRTKRRIEAERAHLTALGALATLKKLCPLTPKASECNGAVPARPGPASPHAMNNRVSGFFDDLLGPTAAGRKKPPVAAN